MNGPGSLALVGSPGSIAQVLIVAAPGGSPPSGPYEFAMATDLTTQA